MNGFVLKGFLIAIAVTVLFSSSIMAETCSKKEVADAVEYASSLVSTKGKACFDELNKFRFCNGEGYIYIINSSQIVILHPVSPQLVGKDTRFFQDGKGKFFLAEMKTKSEKQGSGWESYWWMHPQTKQLEIKCTYFKIANMGGEKVMICSGVYGIPESECK